LRIIYLYISVLKFEQKNLNFVKIKNKSQTGVQDLFFIFIRI